ncbi:hypothetical protein DB30_01294 [Enhygromyxa salina]|uniref:Uncharacterized protein n=1 Tax=Enhygromyxa salina TaxID=215803 RepID=A0A0C2CXG8_9BACT|nr:hypothetical protein DB30_01294 [Enhygromyxa salina]
MWEHRGMAGMGMEQSIRAGTPVGFLGVAAALGLGGCENGDACEGLRTFDAPPAPTTSDTAPPIVLEGEWIGAGVLELQFSKPLAAGNAPDPDRFAVIGWSAQVQSYSGYQGPDTCYVRTRYAGIGQGYYQVNSVADVWIAPEDPSLLRVRMSSTAASCRAATDIVADGVLLVYTDGPTDPVTERLLDAEGDPVPDLGPQWAVQQWEICTANNNYGYNYCRYSLSTSVTGHLPALSVLAPIPCPGA